jgi:hypothetical protein
VLLGAHKQKSAQVDMPTYRKRMMVGICNKTLA